MDFEQNEKTSQEWLTKKARFLFDLWWSTYQALVDAAGSDRALEIIKPYMKFHLDAGMQMGKVKFKLKTDDFYSMVNYLIYGLLIFTGIRCKNLHIFEQGSTVDIDYCPMAKLSESLCLLSQWMNQHSTQTANSSYESIYTKMLIRGDPFCQIMFKKGGHTIWGDVAKKPVEISIPQILKEDLEYWQSAHYSQMWIYATNALVDFAGKEKAVEILRPYMRALGISIATNLSKELGIKDRDAISIASIIERCNQAANQKGKLSFQTPERVEKEITECIFANASQDICADALEARANGICEAINPEYKFISLKRMCKGDKACKWLIIKH